MATKRKKISELPLAASLAGLFTIGVDAANKSVRISLEWLKTTSENVLSAITKAETAAEKANEGATNANRAANAANSAAEDAAAITVLAEEAEQTRQTNEVTRIEAEAIREASEEERLISEEERKESETERHYFETERKIVETERKNAETIREQNEGLRLTEEVKRNEAESGRSVAEALRRQSETGRNTAEGLRNQAEGFRDASELDRIESETGRKSAEAARKIAELDRIEAEGQRASAESERKVSESVRNENEEQRQKDTAQATTNTKKATTRANAAACKSEKLNAHQPLQQIDDSGILMWWVWDLTSAEYINTGLPARGPEGRGPVVLSNGNYGNWDETAADYIDSGVEALATVDLDDIPVVFDQTAERETILSGETVPAIFSKIKKWLSDLGLLAFKNTIDYYSDIDNPPDIPPEQIPADWTQEDSLQRDYIKNKPFIPARTSDIENNTDLLSGPQVRDIVEAHNSSVEAHEDIREKLSIVEAIAKGRSRAEPFDTLEELEQWMTVPENVTGLNVGDNLYIRETSVPDFWWDGSRILPLEVEKVDLSGFYKKEESNIRFSFKPKEETLVLLPSEWVLREGEEDVWWITCFDERIREGCSFEAWPFDRAGKKVAVEAEIDENITVLDGNFTMTSRYKPSDVITIIYKFIQ